MKCPYNLIAHIFNSNLCWLNIYHDPYLSFFLYSTIRLNASLNFFLADSSFNTPKIAYLSFFNTPAKTSFD